MRKGAPRRLSRQATRTSFSRRNFIADERPGRSEVAPDIVSVNIRSQLGLAERIISLKGGVRSARWIYYQRVLSVIVNTGYIGFMKLFRLGNCIGMRPGQFADQSTQVKTFQQFF